MSDESKVALAAKAHTNLNIFAAIVTLLEAGCVYSLDTSRTAQTTAASIVKLCNREQTRQLRIYDRACEEASR